MIDGLSSDIQSITKKEVCQVENVFSQDNLKNQRFDKAVEVSAQLFLKNGIEAVKMTDIADESGIGVATLYRYFGTKNGITIAAMTYMWNELNKMFSGIFESDVFLAQSGIKQVSDLMRMFVVLYEAHPGFMKLLSEFDLMLISENIPKHDLKEYEKSIINFYPVFEKAYMTGIADGTVREIPNLRLFYLFIKRFHTCHSCHAISSCQTPFSSRLLISSTRCFTLVSVKPKAFSIVFCFAVTA